MSNMNRTKLLIGGLAVALLGLAIPAAALAGLDFDDLSLDFATDDPVVVSHENEDASVDAAADPMVHVTATDDLETVDAHARAPAMVEATHEDSGANAWSDSCAAAHHDENLTWAYADAPGGAEAWTDDSSASVSYDVTAEASVADEDAGTADNPCEESGPQSSNTHPDGP